MVRKLQSHDLTDTAAYEAWTVSSDRDKAMHDLGGGTTRDMRNVVTALFLPSLRCPVYTPAERVGLWRAKFAAHEFAVTRESREWRGPGASARLEIPFYLFAGRHDLTTFYPHQKQLFDAVTAPVKGFYTFDASAHSPLFEEPGRAREILRRDVLHQLTDLAD